LLWSADGQKWISFFNVPSAFTSLTVLKDSLFFLGKNSIGKYNLNNNDFMPEKVKDLDPGYVYEDLLNDEENLYIKEQNKIIKYNLHDKSLENINILKDTLYTPTEPGFKVKVFNNNLYLLLEDFRDFYKGILFKLDIEDNTWKIISQNLGSAAFIEKQDTIHFVGSVNFFTGKSSILIPEYYKVTGKNSNVLLSDSGDIKRCMPPHGSIDYLTGIDEVNEDVLIAVGENKYQIISYDKGKTWEPLSFFHAIGSQIDATFKEYWKEAIVNFPGDLVSDSLYFRQRTSQILKSTNAGATWLPQKYSPDMAEFDFAENLDFRANGEGIARVTNYNDDYNIIKTNDYGDTYQLLKEKYIHNYDCYPRFSRLEINGKYLYPMSCLGEDHSRKNILYRYDQNYKFIDSVNLPNGIFVSMVRLNEKLIFLGYRYTGNYKDSSGKFEDYEYEYFMMESNDEGYSWNAVNASLPFYPLLFKQNGAFVLGHGIEYITTLDKKYLFFSGNNIYTYEPQSQKFDSLNVVLGVCDSVKRGPNTIIGAFKVDSTYYFFGYYKFYINKNIYDENSPYDSLDISEAFNSEDYEVFAVKRFEKTVYLSVGKPTGFSWRNEYNMNYIRIHDPNPVPVIEEPPLRVVNYLWASQPYPNPGKNVIKSNIYWGNDLSGEILNFQVYDYLSNKLDAKVDFTSTSSNSGIMSLDCSGMAKGVYTVMVNFPSKQLPVQVVVD
jgi:hypothetical protein